MKTVTLKLEIGDKRGEWKVPKSVLKDTPMLRAYVERMYEVVTGDMHYSSKTGTTS